MHVLGSLSSPSPVFCITFRSIFTDSFLQFKMHFQVISVSLITGCYEITQNTFFDSAKKEQTEHFVENVNCVNNSDYANNKFK